MSLTFLATRPIRLKHVWALLVIYVAVAILVGVVTTTFVILYYQPIQALPFAAGLLSHLAFRRADKVIAWVRSGLGGTDGTSAAPGCLAG